MSERVKPPRLASLDALPAEWGGAVVAIGNFDGMHRGHQAVLEAARARAEAAGRPCLVLTFEPHPRGFFSPGRPFFRLTPPSMKAALAASLGLDGVLVARFDRWLSGMSAADFVSRILVDKLAIAHAVTGYDFHFGHKRQGTPAYLAEEGKARGFGVTIVAEHGDEGGAVSATRIREALAAGEVETANALLGWTWSASGEVIHGEKRGRTLRYPTANMALETGAGLRHGIYAVRFARADGRLHEGVASYGRRPTFDDGAPLLETYLFDFAGDLYGEPALVSLVAWIRAEERFESAEALVRRMDEDAREARARLAQAPACEIDRRIRRAWAREA